MSLTLSTLPRGFSWLRAAYRPSPQEVETYAQIIADAEGIPKESETPRLLQEAELQLWAWRTEHRQRGLRSRRVHAGNGSIFAT